MQWIRKKLSFGSRLALLALAIQLALSFGHVHPDDVRTVSPAAVANLQTPESGSGKAPTDGDRNHAGHDFCAICAALSLTSSSVLPTVALLVTPAAHRVDWADDDHARRILSAQYFPFQARAPPRSL